MTAAERGLTAVRYSDGTISYPGHAVGREGGEVIETIDLSERTAQIITWTNVTATPPGVRSPNPMAIVEFDVDGQAVRALGQLTTSDVSIGDLVTPQYAAELRDPEATVRVPASQEWDGYRFAPVDGDHSAGE